MSKPRKRRSAYRRTAFDGAICPDCGNRSDMKLLYDPREIGPKFGICFKCQYIGQIGAGYVAKERH